MRLKVCFIVFISDAPSGFQERESGSTTSPNKPLKQIVSDLLHALVGALLSDPMLGGIDVSRGTGQAVGPPDGGGIEHDVILGAVVERRGVAPHRFPIDSGISLRDDIHPREFHGRRTMPLPAQETFDRVSLLHSRTIEEPMLRHRQEPAFAPRGPVGRPVAGGQHRNNTKNGIATKEGQVHAFVTGLADIVVHLQ